MKPILIILFLTSSCFGLELSDLPPARMTLAQATPASSSAVSSQAVINEPNAPARPDIALPPTPTKPAKPTPTAPLTEGKKIDPILDTNRPKDCQLAVESEQTIPCGNATVVLPPGTYKQVDLVEGTGKRRANDQTDLKPQNTGLGYIRYFSDTPLKINGTEREGGIDVPVRSSDDHPVRLWYKKMTEPDDITKAFTFILPPVALIAGAGAWSSGNILLPDSPPTFTEYRDYYVKPPKTAPNPSEIPKPSNARPLGAFSAPGSSNLRSK